MSNRSNVLSEQATRKIDRRNLLVAFPNDATRRVFLDAPAPANANAPRALGDLAPGAVLLNRFQVRQTIHPHETSQPGVFLCTGSQGPVVLKVAPLLHPPRRELWERLTSLRHPNILRIFEAVESGGLFYEVQEFCQGGDLALRAGRLEADWIMAHLMPQVTRALEYLHAQGIVHRDVKPSNLFLRQEGLRGQVVLGDFDISSVLDTNRTSRDTSRAGGTWEYTAPEAFPRFVDDAANAGNAKITRAADYFSLGVGIIEMLLGTTSLHACALPDLFDFYLSGQRIELPSGPPRLVTLLKGLLVRDRRQRWGAAQVDEWLRGDPGPAAMQAILRDERYSLNRGVQPYRIGNYHATDLKSLADALELSPQEGKSRLLEADWLTAWISSVDPNVGHQVERTRERYRHQPDVALYRTILLCDPERGFSIPGYGIVSSAAEWLSLVAEKAPTEKHLESGPISEAELVRLEAWLELKAKPEIGLALEVARVRHQAPSVRFEELAYLLDRTLPYSGRLSAFLNLRLPASERLGGRTPAEVVAEALGKGEDWAKTYPPCFVEAKSRWQAGFLEAWMRQRGLHEIALKARQAAAYHREGSWEAFDTFLRHLDPWAEKAKILVDAEAVGCLTVPYGPKKTFSVPYRTEGPGVPFGAVKLVDPERGIHLTGFQVRGRQGTLDIEIEPRVLSGGRTVKTVGLTAAGGNIWMENDVVSVPYQVVLPLSETLKRVGIGALLGGLLLGGSRALVALMLPTAVSGREFSLWRIAGLEGGQNTWQYPLCLAFLFAVLYGAFRLWLEVMKGGEI